MWEKLYQSFNHLPDEEKKKFIRAMERDKTSIKSDIAKLISNIRETRFSEGLGCLHCGSTAVVRHGKYRGRQRYKCKDCFKTFNDMNNTPLGGTHKPHLVASVHRVDGGRLHPSKNRKASEYPFIYGFLLEA